MAKKESGEPKSEASTAEPAKATVTTEPLDKIIVKGAVKRELPRRRTSRTYEFHISDLKGFFTVGEYEDGTPGELFINVSKQGSTLSGLMDSFAISVSHGLQYGVPLKSYVKTMRGTSFAPSGITDDGDIRTASSITDYIFRRLALDYLSFDDRLELGLASIEDVPAPEAQVSLLADDSESTNDASETAAQPVAPLSDSGSQEQTQSPAAKPIGKDSTAPLCYNCGNQTQRSGSCYVCTSCGSTTGCS